MTQTPQTGPRVLLVPLQDGWQNIPAGQLVAVSDDLDQIDAARELAESLHRSNCLFIVGSADDIPWRDDYFDVAYVSGPAGSEVIRVCKAEATIEQRHL